MPATDFADLPIDPERERSYQEAEVAPRVRAWASSDGSGDPDKIDFGKFRRAFLWYDSSKPDEIGSYRLKIGDVVGGQLVAIWRGITVIAAVLQGARGGTTIPEADRAAVKSQIDKYYSKAAKLFKDPSIRVPWDDSAGRSEQADDVPMLFRRVFALDDIQIVSRAKGGDGRTVEAYASVFGREVPIADRHGRYLETIDRGAFNRTISSGAAMKAQVLLNHGYDTAGQTGGLQQVPIGKPVDIRADDRGLLTVSRYNDSALADATLAAIRNGDITAQSFQGKIYRSDPMRVPPPRGNTLPKVRRLELGLRDYGPTPHPAYEEAAITVVRSLDELAHDFASLDAAQREELLRTLSTTPGWDPETAAVLATPHRGPGADDPRDAHSARQRFLRLRAELRSRSI